MIYVLQFQLRDLHKGQPGPQMCSSRDKCRLCLSQTVILKNVFTISITSVKNTSFSCLLLAVRFQNGLNMCQQKYW